MAAEGIKWVFILQCLLMITLSSVQASWLNNAMRPEPERDLRSLEKKHLLNEVEVQDEEQELEEIFSRRSDEEEFMNQLNMLKNLERRQEIRYTPVPAIRRLKMTPPPGVPLPVYRLDQTPVPPHGRRPTPEPGSPESVKKPLRQTPKPLRLTPVPPVRPPVRPQEPGDLIDDSNPRPLRPTPIPVLSLEERIWRKVQARRAQEEIERERRSDLAELYNEY